jgi:hypothetical protein
MDDRLGGCHAARVAGSSFDQEAFFAAIAASGARALLLGRRALLDWAYP